MEQEMPKQLFVVMIDDQGNKEPITYKSVDDICQDHKGSVIGVYRLSYTRNFEVKKTLTSNPVEA